MDPLEAAIKAEEMNDRELLAAWAAIDDGDICHVEQAVLDEIERRNPDI